MALTRLFFLILSLSVLGIQNTQAEETDQFTLPPGELQDLGPFTSNRLVNLLEGIIAKTNTDIRTYQHNVKQSGHARRQLALRRKGTYLADSIYSKTGPGYPLWLRGSPPAEPGKPREFKERLPWKTVYWLVFSQSPLFVIGLAPTINMYNYYFGTDKLGHFFMQGHTYYKLYTYLRAHGKSDKQAKAALILYGQILEQTYLGTLINGVYSNGDLSANYSGWKFYMNLTQPIKIGEKTLPPILKLKNDQWVFARPIDRDNLLKPYLTDNFNEALNPSRHAFMRGQIRKHIQKRCAEWIKRGLTKEMVAAKLKEINYWHGEPYGHWLPKDNAVTLNTCFGGR